MNKNILICVSGLTPQIITETLFCLSVQKKISIDELFIVTTSRGRDVLTGDDEKIKYPSFKGELKAMCSKYKIKLPRFEYTDNILVAKEQSIELSDIRNDKQNKLFPNKLCEFINEKTRDKTDVLYCSISGGRKSMSVDMAFALSLFGRENDKLLHVLTHEGNEFKGFYPQNKKEEKELELSELPYVRLRSIISEVTNNENLHKSNYLDLVEFTQKELKKKSADKLFISLSRREMWYANNERVSLEPKQIDLYRYFIESNSSAKTPVKIEALVNHFSIDKRTGEKIKGYDETNIRSLISKMNKNKIIPALINTDLTDHFLIQSGKYATYGFYVNADSSNVTFLD